MPIYREQLMEELKKLDFKSVLDCGCGDRWLEREVLEKAEYYGFDSELDFNGDLPYSDKSFDLVITCAVLCTMKDITKAVENMKRIARKYIVLCELQGDYKDYTTGESLPNYNTTRIMRDYPKLFGLKFKKFDIPKDVWPGVGWDGEAPGKIMICELQR